MMKHGMKLSVLVLALAGVGFGAEADENKRVKAPKKDKVEISQTGDYNQANFNSTGENNMGDITQTGQYNEVNLGVISGSTNHIDINQVDNTGIVDKNIVNINASSGITGSNNQYFVNQIKESTDRSEINNELEMDTEGSDNTYFIDQTGTGHKVELGGNHNGAFVEIEQSGGYTNRLYAGSLDANDVDISATQSGNLNDLRVSGSLNGGEFTVTQLQSTNTARLSVDVKDHRANKIESYQSGYANMAVLKIDNSLSDSGNAIKVSTLQTGDRNQITDIRNNAENLSTLALIENSWGYSGEFIVEGDNFDVTQNGDFNLVQGEQTSAGSSITVNQDGDQNLATVTQTAGINNQATIIQINNNNIATINQVGSDNVASITQAGFQNQAIVSQIMP